MKRLFDIPSDVELDDEALVKMVSFLGGTILESGFEDKYWERDIVYFNELWRPNWKRLYERFNQFQLDNPGCKEWACFDHDSKLEFVKHPGQIVTSCYNFPNEYSDRKIGINTSTAVTSSEG